jgi:ABC-type Mn2+/Zn2+ transport system permease subunit
MVTNMAEVVAPAAGGLWHAIADPWSQTILSRAFLEITLIGLIGGPLGCWIVFYGLSYSAESLAHGLFPGLVIAALTGIPLLVGGAAGLVVAALGIAIAGRVPTIGRDTAVAIVITTLFGMGALLALAPASPPGIQNLLFGDVLGVTDGDLLFAGAAVVVTWIALRLMHGSLIAVGFDRESARSLGVSPVIVDAALLVLLSLAILVAVQGLGNLLALAMLVAPAATAAVLVKRFAPMLFVASGLAVAAGIGGLYVSYYANTAAGASIAGVTVVLYAVATGGAWAVRASRSTRDTRPAVGGREPGYARTR